MKIILVSLILLVTSCISPNINPAIKEISKENINNLPNWVLNPEVENAIGAVGIASPSRGGLKFQIRRAEMDGKANIASIIQSEISRVTKEALRESNVNDVNDVEQVFTQATKEVVKNIPLSGVTKINQFSAADGTLYLHMVLKDKDYSQFLKNSQKIFEKRLESANLGRSNIDKSQDAVKELFEELERERD